MPPEMICDKCGNKQYAMFGDKCHECRNVFEIPHLSEDIRKIIKIKELDSKQTQL